MGNGMQLYAGRVYFGKKRFLPAFLLGIAAGILMVNLGKSTLIGETGMFDEYTLYGMRNMSVSGSALFWYVCRKRLLTLLVLATLATTYLGYVVCVGTAFWYGMAVGSLPAVLVFRYGFKGLILAIVAIFPQYLLYAPAMVLLLGWSSETHRRLYTGGILPDGADRVFLGKKMLQLGVIALLILMGCLLEGYVNPLLLIAYLKTF